MGDYDAKYSWGTAAQPIPNNNIADSLATEYIYYINEATQVPGYGTSALGYDQDKHDMGDGLGLVSATAGVNGWTRKWDTSFTQSVQGCPVAYKIFVTRWLSDSTRLGNPSQSWRTIKTAAMVDATFQSEAWYAGGTDAGSGVSYT